MAPKNIAIYVAVLYRPAMNKMLFVLVGLLSIALPASAQTRTISATATVIVRDTTTQSSVFQLSMMEQSNELSIISPVPIFMWSKIKKDTVVITVEYISY